MEKEFVSYKTALALKELGFDEPCFGYYDTATVSYLTYPSAINKNSDIENSLSISKQDKNVRCSAPTYSQVFRWFRDKHKINSGIVPRYDYFYFIIKNFGSGEEYYSDDMIELTYEEAESACLDKLIEIIKNK